MMNTIIAALRAEQAEGNTHADQIVERIDAHIRDLETLKAWVLDGAKVRSLSIDSLISGPTDATHD